jgi:DNA-binding NtrC family response regulator
MPGGSDVWSADGVSLAAVERDLIAKALKESGNNRSRAARLLGITRSQLYYRMQKHGLDVAASGSSG